MEVAEEGEMEEVASVGDEESVGVVPVVDATGEVETVGLVPVVEVKTSESPDVSMETDARESTAVEERVVDAIEELDKTREE